MAQATMTAKYPGRMRLRKKTASFQYGRFRISGIAAGSASASLRYGFDVPFVHYLLSTLLPGESGLSASYSLNPKNKAIRTSMP